MSQPNTERLAEAQWHRLKTWPEYFEQVYSGAKTFECRKDDRGFIVGDFLLLQEWDRKTGDYTGREIEKRVSYILRGTEHVAPGYCILALAANTSAPSPAGGEVIVTYQAATSGLWYMNPKAAGSIQAIRIGEDVYQVAPASPWIAVSPEGMPEHGFPVLGYNPDWVHEDYNPTGIRECQQCDGEWSTAAWNATQDDWYNSPEQPTHWQPLPAAPTASPTQQKGGGL